MSRGLQRLAEDLPVLEKRGRRWELTELGKKVNAETRAYLDGLKKAISASQPAASSLQDAVLVVINAQRGLQAGGEAAQGQVLRLLRHWRAQDRRVVHVKHVSQDPRSPFHRGSQGSEFLSALAPGAQEPVVEKTQASAFAGTELPKLLQDARTLVLAGFTANECIDATAKDAAAAGWSVLVAGDATAMFDFTGIDGKLVKADRVHRLVLENLHALCARVVATDDLL